MQYTHLDIPDVLLLTPKVFGDERGFFMEFWQAEKFAQMGIDLHFVQDNHSRSRHGILRGLHYQIEQPQGKLIKVVNGQIFDVAVDLRQSSPTFGRWVGTTLSDENKQMLWVPPGFAHGLYATSQSADVIYKCTDFYAPQHERTIRWDDPDLAIEWPTKGEEPLVSEKDAGGVFFKDAEVYREL
jgi:dTDP-4-dehydrorhamnose 3,5-epimerase